MLLKTDLNFIYYACNEIEAQLVRSLFTTIDSMRENTIRSRYI